MRKTILERTDYLREREREKLLKNYHRFNLQIIIFEIIITNFVKENLLGKVGIFKKILSSVKLKNCGF